MAREQTHSAQKGHASKSGGSKASSAKGKNEKGQSGKGQISSPDSPAQIQKFLAGVDYPVKKQDLVEKARQQGADKEVMAALEKLPEREYSSPVGVSREIGKLIH